MKKIYPKKWARWQLLTLIPSRKMSVLLVTSILLWQTPLQARDTLMQINVSVDANEVSLKMILHELEKQSGMKFVYLSDEIDKQRKVSIEVHNTSLGIVLNNLFSGTDISYEQLGEQILLKRLKQRHFLDNEPGLIAATSAFTVSGIVTDENDAVLPGVNVLEKGTLNGTTTDTDGRYTIVVQDENAVLIFSFIGYVTQEVPGGSRTQLNIKLVSDVTSLEEVVVVGYGEQKKENLTGAISFLDTEVLESRQITNLGQGLQGLIPNLNISFSNGGLNSSASFNVRGNTSINDAGPLILVDGVQMSPNQINPNDVESVTVLKDAASAAIYGARAAFGVILITTKKGKKNTPLQVSYKTSYSLNTPTRLPAYLNSIEYVDMFREASATSGGTNQGEMFNDPDFYAQVQEYLQNPTPENSIMPAKFGDTRKYWYTGNTDWYEEVYRKRASSKTHDLSVSGGSGKSAYYASLGFFDQGSLLRHAHESYNRYNVSLGGSTEANKWLTLSGSIKYNRKELDQPNPIFFSSAWIGQDLKPTMPVRFPDGNFSGQGDYTNPIAVQELNGRQIFKSNDLWLSGAIKITPRELKGFSFNFNYTAQKYGEDKTNHQKDIQEFGIDGLFLGYFPHTHPNYYRAEGYNVEYSSLNAYADYEKTFAAKHYVKAMVGFNQELNESNSFYAKRTNLINNDLPSLRLATDESPEVSNVASAWALRGAFFRLNYIFSEKYLLEINGRYDGSSRFPKSSRFDFFPSISAGWRISEEGFMNATRTAITDLKFRASYGKLGNQVLNNNYPYIASLSTTPAVNYVMDNSLPVGIGPAGLVSPTLAWENVSTVDGGVDFTLFERLSGTFDYYVRKSTGMLTTGMQLPAVLGTGVPVENAADLQTKGWELSLAWMGSTKRNFSYNIGFVLADYQAEITKFDNPTGSLASSHYVGQKLGEIWGYETVGFLTPDGAVAANSDPESPLADPSSGAVSQKRIWGNEWMAGDLQYADLNGDGRTDQGQNTISNPGDRKIIGNSTPRYSYGLTGRVIWKNFDVDFFFQGIAKRDYALGGNVFWGFTGEWNVPMAYHKDHWTPENVDAYFPRLRIDGSGNQQTQTKYLQNAAYLRLKNISIAYTVPGAITEKIHVNKVRLYFSGQNVFEHTRMFEAYDPEILTNTEHTLQRSWVLGGQISF